MFRARSSEKTLSGLQHQLQNMKDYNKKLESTVQKLKVEVQLLRKKTILVSRVSKVYFCSFFHLKRFAYVKRKESKFHNFNQYITYIFILYTITYII